MPGLRGFFLAIGLLSGAATRQEASPVAPAGLDQSGEAVPRLISSPPPARSHSMGTLRSVDRGCPTFCMAPNAGGMEERQPAAKESQRKHRFEGSLSG